MTIFFAGAAAAALVASAPNANPPSDRPATEQSPKAGETKGAKNKIEPFDVTKLLAVFDKIFPPQPEPQPERLALSRVAVNGLLPDGTYSRAMGGMIDDLVDRFLSLSETDFGAKEEEGQPPRKLTLRDELKKDDPHFEERMRITRRVLGEEMAKIAVIIEPKMREGLARSMARRLDARQLADLNVFLATESGRAFGGESMAMWIDGDVMRSIMASFPEMITAMPAAMKRLEEATAHLPKPKKDKDKKDGEDQAAEVEAEE